MGMEIERKFLVTDGWMNYVTSVHSIKQGYLAEDNGNVVRVRVQDDNGFLTIKGKPTGISCQEYEFPISKSSANDMLKNMCRSVISKKRFIVPFFSGQFPYKWEIDLFLDDNEGLVVAEVELYSEKDEINLPSWVSKEVTGDKKYLNVNLAKNPFKTW